MLAFLFLLASVAAQGPDIFYFSVYSDPQCTIGALSNPPAAVPMDTSQRCFLLSYVSPVTGQLQTNAHEHWDCQKDYVTFAHYPSSDRCDPTPSRVIHMKLSSNDCMPYQTHTGMTYQKLVNYTQCSARSDDPSSSIDSNPDESSIDSNPEESSIDSNPDESSIDSNPDESSIDSHPAEQDTGGPANCDPEPWCTTQQTRSCSTWARQGQCSVNPSFMHACCKRECRLPGC